MARRPPNVNFQGELWLSHHFTEKLILLLIALIELILINTLRKLTRNRLFIYFVSADNRILTWHKVGGMTSPKV